MELVYNCYYPFEVKSVIEWLEDDEQVKNESIIIEYKKQPNLYAVVTATLKKGK